MMKRTKYMMRAVLTIVFALMSVCAIAQDKMTFTVAKDGSGDFTTIQAAVDACRSFPDSRVTVFIRNGVYREKVRIADCNTMLSFIGEDAEKTIISWDDYFSRMERGKNSTFYTYTLMIEANDFYAENLTIENTAGPVGQAVALHVEGDRCVFRNCRILGNQDTLYTAGQNSRQYFDGCYIEGTTDFIFGAATVLFDNCEIRSKRDSYITAASTPQGKPFGYVFRNCRLTADEGVTRVYLGRPWRDYAKVVFINCYLGSHILPEGWANWDKTNRDKTAWYAEFGNSGPGAGIPGRVPWSHQLKKREAAKYTIENILAAVFPTEPPVKQWTKGNDML